MIVVTGLRSVGILWWDLLGAVWGWFG